MVIAILFMVVLARVVRGHDDDDLDEVVEDGDDFDGDDSDYDNERDVVDDTEEDGHFNNIHIDGDNNNDDDIDEYCGDAAANGVDNDRSTLWTIAMGK
jgi:hypothetical protein